MLVNPDLNKPVNLEAAEMITRSPHAYRQMVLDCVLASQRVEGSYQGMDPAKYSKLLWQAWDVTLVSLAVLIEGKLTE